MIQKKNILTIRHFLDKPNFVLIGYGLVMFVLSFVLIGYVLGKIIYTMSLWIIYYSNLLYEKIFSKND